MFPLQERRALPDLRLLPEAAGRSAQSGHPRQSHAGRPGDRRRAEEGAGADDQVSDVRGLKFGNSRTNALLVYCSSIVSPDDIIFTR